MMKRKMLSVAAGMAASLATVGMLSVPAFAASAHPTPPGYSTAITASGGCADAGSFGYFGPGQNFGNAVSGHINLPGGPNSTSPNSFGLGNGADGPATGYNNSNNCGSPAN